MLHKIMARMTLLVIVSVHQVHSFLSPSVSSKGSSQPRCGFMPVRMNLGLGERVCVCSPAPACGLSGT